MVNGKWLVSWRTAVQQILGNNIGLVSVSCLDNLAGEKGQQDWSVGCLDSGAGDTEKVSKT